MRGDGKGTRLMMLDNLTENPSHRMSTASQKLKTYPFVLHGTDHKIPYNCRLLEKKSLLSCLWRWPLKSA